MDTRSWSHPVPFKLLLSVCAVSDVSVVSLWCLCCLSGLGLSQDVAGATFMAAGSSAPELVTAFLGKPAVFSLSSVSRLCSRPPAELSSLCFLLWDRCVCDEGGHWREHHRGLGRLQPAGHLCGLWTLGLHGTLPWRPGRLGHQEETP